ncbi:ISsod5, transposase [Yersinia enterocolitica subsp. palearctica YE-P4]|uniref:Mutator family transposase n=3 Tax=Yersinia enterocolitica TaxID=630 RepID=A0A7U0ATW8_YEREN|nr:IS256 family transposase [Yersinia enterocolitica]EOR68502.1 ISsod5, transposase [Yersinia enterocolitica subsp. palearctica YE-149]EOR78001.1 ISsod5, transposase [Yersinia enterocolitica subsp. palearctica YE-150]EOR78274.1 ISsod5, transposase [Yersinia enterocolitica subsp. palearctica YE-P1]EOR82596.1 ISsod5, transposase [Yersinia enterocolitica subsp. palearctica YE-P4]MDW9423199.1 IS256 family transposase [Yersinia enterocolitica]
MSQPFDFDKALKALQSGQALTGKDGILTPLIKQLTEAALAAELDSHLAQDLEANRKNGFGKKTIKAPTGRFELTTPRDRNGTFEPQLVKKHQTTLSDEIERKIIRMFALGMSYKDISQEIEDLYAFSVSSATISAVTDKVIPELKQWQQRPLEAVYPFVWLDAIHYKIRENGRYQSKAVYTVLALNLEGKKEILGLYLSENEGANFWLSVLTDLQNRGVNDILVACVDGLTGFPEAINSIYPDTEVQLCVIHQIRNSIKYVASKHHKAFMADLKPVYRAVSKEAAETALDELEEKWGQQYPVVLQSWRKKWENLSHYFRYPATIRKVIYTTNAIESVHRQFRKLTKTKGAFPNENSLLKLLYLGLMNAQEKWTMPIQSWNLTLSQLAIYFEGRLDKVITL